MIPPAKRGAIEARRLRKMDLMVGGCLWRMYGAKRREVTSAFPAAAM
jgi:hypothetical protein